jgi:antirestriction protein ArdC
MNTPNAYERITQTIIEHLERGTVPWRRPWRGGEAGIPRNLHSGRPYRGINVFLLALTGHESPYWVTFRQARELGGTVRRGSKGYPVIFWNWLSRPASAEEEDDRVPFLRGYTVFNAEQCEGLELPVAGPVAATAFEPIAACERVITEMPHPPSIVYGRSLAMYVPAIDTIYMPHPEQFSSPEHHYATLFHEAVHGTGHAVRLNRKTVVDPTRFASHDYGREELVAELGASYLCGHCGIETATIDNAAAYIQSWLNVLRGDARLVVQAAAQAQRAADYILRRQPGELVESKDATAGAASAS